MWMFIPKSVWRMDGDPEVGPVDGSHPEVRSAIWMVILDSMRCGRLNGKPEACCLADGRPSWSLSGVSVWQARGPIVWAYE